MCERSPEDVALPGLAFNTPEPESTPEAVCEAIPDVDAAPSLEIRGPTFFAAVLRETLDAGSRFALSFPRWETSGMKRIKIRFFEKYSKAT